MPRPWRTGRTGPLPNGKETAVLHLPTDSPCQVRDFTRRSGIVFRHPVQPRRRVQGGSKSVAAPLISVYAYVQGNPVDYNDPSGAANPIWHAAVTFLSATNEAGYSLADAASLSWDVTLVDLGTQGYDAADTNLHAMAGRKANGMQQTCQEAIQGATEEVAHSLGDGNLARAVHTVQDAATDSHKGQPWPPPADFNWFGVVPDRGFGLLAHVGRDLVPTIPDLMDMYLNTSRLLRDSTQSPGSYLKPHFGPAPCQ